jgi:hypothetical protein
MAFFICTLAKEKSAKSNSLKNNGRNGQDFQMAVASIAFSKMFCQNVCKELHGNQRNPALISCL